MARRPLKERWKELLAEYGRFALIIYIVLFLGSIAGFAIAISSGLDLGDWTGGKAGTVAAAWVATKVTQPVRILVTLGLTPIVARVFRGPAPEAVGEPVETGAPVESSAPAALGELSDESE